MASVVLILFKNNGKYIRENLGIVGMAMLFGLKIVSIVNYGLSRTLLYCYPILFIKKKGVNDLRSFNQLISLISLPGAVFFYFEFR